MAKKLEEVIRSLLYSDFDKYCDEGLVHEMMCRGYPNLDDLAKDIRKEIEPMSDNRNVLGNFAAYGQRIALHLITARGLKPEEAYAVVGGSLNSLSYHYLEGTAPTVCADRIHNLFTKRMKLDQ